MSETPSIPVSTRAASGAPREKLGEVSSTIGTISAADELAAKVAALETQVANKSAKVAKLKLGLSEAQSRSSDLVPQLQETLAKKQNKINLLKGNLATAQTLESSRKTEAILAENKLGEASQAAGSTRTFGLLAIGAVVLAVVAWKKGWIHL